jgi:hypothetical protein
LTVWKLLSQATKKKSFVFSADLKPRNFLQLFDFMVKIFQRPLLQQSSAAPQTSISPAGFAH